ncbi:MAG: histidine kinase dimerization/phospho-acceptor domain-containing protein [bacterium]|jgi:signal transduction histidine kinase|nr:MAG: hypothetical protein DIU52_01715 [bacterium]
MEQDRLREIVSLVRQVRHDANNPLTAALGNVQLALGEPVLDDAEIRRTLRTVEAELLKLAEILRRLDAVKAFAAPAPTPPAPPA